MNSCSLKQIARAVIPTRYHQLLRDLRYRFWDTSLRSYSQQGEDIVLRLLFSHVAKGFYVDVGAYHPVLYSNTYYFYRRGWNGINIDATPGTMDLFRSIRPRDINLELAISKTKRDLVLRLFNQGALNTLSEELGIARASERPEEHARCKLVATHSLVDVLEQYCLDGRSINFLNVDVEGSDLDVLESNDWERFMPDVVLCEDLSVQDLESVAHSTVCSFMRAQGYALFSKCINTLIFVQKGSFLAAR